MREVKLARRIGAKDHPEIALQLQIYGWLYAQTLDRPPLRLEVLNGAGDLCEIPYDPAAALAALTELVRMARRSKEPYSPVGWTKCADCGYREHCWSRAKAERDAALVVGVDQGLARALRAQGVKTIEGLLERFDEARLGALVKEQGGRQVRVGKQAVRVLRMARALHADREEWFAAPEVPEAAAYVCFDLEGLPPQFDELEKVYLWGWQVRGPGTEPYAPAKADFGPDGDRIGWERFLRGAQGVLERWGDIPWLHWGNYERTHLDQYRERYGDPEGTAGRVLGNLVDLLPITQGSVALPVYSYGLKTVEKHIGFQRRLEEGRGDWSMAKYIEAVETQDPREREARMNEILMYNEEDLQATWAVFQWLKAASK